MSGYPRARSVCVSGDIRFEFMVRLVIALLVCMSVSGCWLWQQQTTESGVAALEKFESAEAMKAYLAEKRGRH